jgi:hypothetical protein
MGLDQWCHKVKSSTSEDGLTETITKTQLQEWRKHYPLQEWMGKLWHEERGNEHSFNCADMRLTKTDLDCLEKVILADELPPEEWMELTEKDKADAKAYDLEFIQKAREALADGWRIVYSSWW